MFLIQTGKFYYEPTDFKGLTGRNGVVDLDYMGSSEFEFGAIPRSYRRIMYNFKNYEYNGTGIYTPENDELITFSYFEDSEEIIKDINKFVKNPWHLKEYSGLEKVPTAKKTDTGFYARRQDFWWCIDLGEDWMAFLNSNKDLFEKAITKDYYEWWLNKPEEKREEEYKLSLRM